METKRKLPILPIVGAVLLVIERIVTLLNSFRYMSIYGNIFTLSNLAAYVLPIVACALIVVFAVMGKKGLLAIPCAVMAVPTLFYTLKNVLMGIKNPSTSVGTGVGFDGIVYMLAWVVLAAACAMEFVSNAEGLKKVKTTLSKLFMVAVVLYALLHVVSSVQYIRALYFGEYFKHFDRVLAFDLLSYVVRRGLALLAYLAISLGIAFHIAPFPKKEKPVATMSSGEGAQAAATPSGEYYISLVKHILLLLFTFGIWNYIWIYKTTKFTNTVEGESTSDPVVQLLLCLFVPYYVIYWTYKAASRVQKMMAAKGDTSDITVLCVILAIFVSFVPPILLQEKINKLVSPENG